MSKSAVVVGCLILAAVAPGQETTATFFGVVTDPTGAAIPGAAVTFQHRATGGVATKNSDWTGEFQFDFLRVGTYTLTIQAPGFKRFESSGLELGAAQRVRQTFVLEVGSVTEIVEVTGQTPLVNTVSAEQRESLSSRQLLELPVARRSFHNLLTLGTGIDTAGNGGVRMNGIGRAGLKVTVDGTDATSNAESPGTSMYQAFNYIHVMSVEAIQEVEVSKGVTSAEYGQQLSGNVNLISKSGTNNWHGSLFENFRAENLNATPRRLGRKEPANFNQFGGSLGGPIQRDKIFIFGTYEGYRERTSQILEGDVPTASLRQEAIRAVPGYKTVLDTYYLPNLPSTNPDTARFRGVAPQSRDDNHGVVKGDIRLSSVRSLALTYTRGRPNRLSPEGRVQIPNSRRWNGLQERGTASFLTGGASWNAETRFGYNFNDIIRVDGFWDTGFDSNRPEDTYGGRRTPSLSVVGLFGDGGGSEIVNYTGPVWSLEQKYARHTGQHSFKFGGVYGRRQPSRFNIENPRITYANKADFLANSPRDIQVTFGTNEYRGRSYEFGFFVQDDWRLKPNLVINLGVRYDFYSKYVAKPADPKSPAFLFNLNGLLDNQFNFGPFRDPLDPYESDGGVNIGPRIGFSYNPDGKSKTVIRGGASVLFAPQPLDTMANAVANAKDAPFRRNFSRTETEMFRLRFPAYNDDVRRLASGSGVFIADVFDPHLPNPYTMNLSLGIQRTLTSTMALETAFVANRGSKFRLYRVFNYPDRVTDIRPNRNLGQGNYLCSCQNTSYASWQTSLRKRYSRRLTFDAHYTWGKGLSYTGGDTGAGFSGDAFNTVQDFFNYGPDRGPSSGDTTHRFVADFIYELPSLVTLQNAAARHVLGGWQIAGVLNGRTGTPAYISQSGLTSRPDYLGGEPILRDSKQTGVYLNRSVFALVPLGVGRNPIRSGNLGNSAIRGPSLWGMNASIAKSFQITEHARFQFGADLFNALNYTPYTGFTTGINSTTFGQFTGHAGAREIELNGRLVW